MNEVKKFQLFVLDKLAELQAPHLYLEEEEGYVAQGMEAAYEEMLVKIDALLNGNKDWEDAK